MRFSTWYPLDEASDQAPDRPGVFQVRMAEGLTEYPQGQSAMVRYGGGPSVQVAAAAFADKQTDHRLLCRHSLDVVSDPAAALERMLADFRARFGAEPGGT